MELDLVVNNRDTSFRTRVKLYKKRAQEIEKYLSKKPEEWGKFQSEFNSEVNGFFREIMNFEKINLANGNEEKVYKLKRLFVRKIKQLFARGVYCNWSIRKPYGYPGDFKIINDIYQNNPTTTGFERLFDNYFQMSAIAVAVRNRKEDFKRLILDFVSNKQKKEILIMDLASGPCQDIKEILSLNSQLCKNLIFDCYDNDERAIEYAKSFLKSYSNINFYKENAARLALKKNIRVLINKKYDLIFCTGLFDYFDERIAIRLIQNLKKLLNPNSIMGISNVRDKYSNPSVHFMEWAGDWNLVYRNDDEFRKLFLDAGFKKSELETRYEQQGIMQYVIAYNRQV